MHAPNRALQWPLTFHALYAYSLQPQLLQLDQDQFPQLLLGVDHHELEEEEAARGYGWLRPGPLPFGDW